MPSFAFWKTAKQDDSTSSLLSNIDGRSSSGMPIEKDLDLNPGNQESGVFLFDDEVISRSSQREAESEIASASTKKLAVMPNLMDATDVVRNASVREWNSSAIDATQSTAGANLLPLVMQRSRETNVQEPTQVSATDAEAAALPVDMEMPSPPLQPVSHTATASPAATSTRSRPHPATLQKLAQGDRDSGVYMSDDETLPPQSESATRAQVDSVSRSRAPSLLPKHSLSTTSTIAPQRIDRLRRPAELNLGMNTSSDVSKSRSELEKRHDLIRSSTTQSKAALRSPTQLLKERLNMSPRKDKYEEKIHSFVPPKAAEGGCLLPGPGTSAQPFSSTSVRARTEAGSRPAWWCKVDKLVVFDGIEVKEDGELKILARTSKGLSIARRRGDLETIVIPMDCAHCQDMLNRHEWKYDMRVCKRSVCWDCKERCKWEMEEARRVEKSSIGNVTPRPDTSRYRADSVLQDDEMREEDLMRKIGIEQGRAKSPIELVKGIEERLENSLL